MSFLNFSENLFALIWNTSETLVISKLEITEKLILEHIRVRTYIKCAVTGSVKLEVYKYGSTTKLFESNLVNIQDIGADFLGNVRFDFGSNNMALGIYEVKASVSGYTRNADTSYFSLLYDFPVKIYPNVNTHFDEHSIAIEVFGKK